MKLGNVLDNGMVLSVIRLNLCNCDPVGRGVFYKIGSSIQWAERIMPKIDNVFGN